MARGLYSLPDVEITEHQTLIEVCHRVPKAVLCLLSALQFHGIGTQMLHAVWVALPQATQTPTLGSARCALHIDVGFGDAVTPGPQTVVYPTLLTDFQAPLLRVYPVYSVIAE